jgi:hypothetical protein
VSCGFALDGTTSFETCIEKLKLWPSAPIANGVSAIAVRQAVVDSMAECVEAKLGVPALLRRLVLRSARADRPWMCPNAHSDKETKKRKRKRYKGSWSGGGKHR